MEISHINDHKLKRYESGLEYTQSSALETIGQISGLRQLNILIESTIKRIWRT